MTENIIKREEQKKIFNEKIEFLLKMLNEEIENDTDVLDDIFSKHGALENGQIFSDLEIIQIDKFVNEIVVLSKIICKIKSIEF